MKITPQQAVQVQTITGSNSSQWKMTAADLGVMWLAGDGNTTFHVFGDNGGPGSTPAFSGPNLLDYRPNALARSSHLDLYQGLTFDNFNVDSHGDRTAILPLLAGERGCVPSGGINIGGVDYLSYVALSSGTNDQAHTNAGGTAQSTDGGKTWSRNFNCYWNQNAQLTDPFQQSVFAYDGGAYVYRFSTQSARQGDIHLMRTPTASVADKTKYQYWTGSAWSTDQTQVGILIPGPAGEMSARYDDLLGAWMVLYHDDNAQHTVFQWAPSPTGPWSAKASILDDSNWSPYGIYAPEIHPQSAGTSLWFCGSDWNTYETNLFYANLNVSC